MERLLTNGVLEFDQSVTVGNALNGYQYFGDKRWTSFQDPQKRQIVEFSGDLDYDKFAGSELQGVTLTTEHVNNAKHKLGVMNPKSRYVAQFAVSQSSSTFELKYSGVKMSFTNKDTGRTVEKDIPDQNSIILQQIYANNPEPSTWGLLLSAGIQK